jgi:6-phosphogluconolactonase
LTVGDGDPARSEVHARALFETAPYANRDFDAGVLGMGLDGHTASLFPGASQLASALDPVNRTGACRIDPVPLPPEAPFPRITLTLTRLLRARELHLVIVGDAKRAVLRAAQTDPDPARHPISALLHASHTLVHVHWSPT